MQSMPIRLAPGADLRGALEDLMQSRSAASAFVIAGIGSLAGAAIRYAGEAAESRIDGPLEILTLCGSLSAASDYGRDAHSGLGSRGGPAGSGAHLHMSVADASGRVFGGHVGYGNTIRTTAEILLVLLPDWRLTREHDAATGFNELVVRRRT